MNTPQNPFSGVKVRLDASALELILSIPDNDALNQVYSTIKSMVDGPPGISPIPVKRINEPDIVLESPIGFAAVGISYRGVYVGWIAELSQCAISELDEFNAVYILKTQYQQNPLIYLISLTDSWRQSLGIRGNHASFSAGLKTTLGYSSQPATGTLYYGFARTASNNGIADHTGRMLFMDRNSKMGPLRSFNKLKLAIMSKGVIYKSNEGLQYLKSHGPSCECKICKRFGPFIRWYKK